VLGDCIDLHNQIGSQRKFARLQELTRYWVDRASEIDGFRIHTPMDSPELGGVASFSLAGIPVDLVEKRLREEFKVQTRKRVPEGLKAIRVSPQLYSSKSELDELVLAIKKIAAGRG
jgi:selenocysteine lyase/cysteine desulfurase